MNYPDSWPKPNTKFPRAVTSRITEQEKEALYNRSITTRALAERLGVREKWLSVLFPGKVPAFSRDKRVLRAVRKEFRDLQAKAVIAKTLKIHQAAVICRISYRSMARAVQIMKAEMEDKP